MEHKGLLLAALRKIRENGPQKRGSGICWNLELVLRDVVKASADREDVLAEFKLLCHHWPLFSGSPTYPIVDRKLVLDCLHKDMSRQAAMQYDGANRYRTMWDRRYRYGKLRWQLLDWAIEQLMGDDHG